MHNEWQSRLKRCLAQAFDEERERKRGVNE
jgi:hypothetical protein